MVDRGTKVSVVDRKFLLRARSSRGWFDLAGWLPSGGRLHHGKFDGVLPETKIYLN